MERQRNDLLAELARDAALERSEFLVRAGEQLERFLADQADRVKDLGGLTLIDDDPDYLAMAPDGTFRSRSRVYDDARGEWLSETEIIEAAGELVELYNPADIYQAFADVAREGVWSDGAGPGTDAGATEDAPTFSESDPYAAAADQWAAGQPEVRRADTREDAAAALYDLTLDFQERSQRAEAGLLEQFEIAASSLMSRVGPVVIVDDLDEHLELSGAGFRGQVIPEGETRWTDLSGPEDVVRFYDPTDIFGDLADAIAEANPGLADAESSRSDADDEDRDDDEDLDDDEDDADEDDADEDDGDEDDEDADDRD